jgi:tetratricopeptide (TPR) repeat protein
MSKARRSSKPLVTTAQSKSKPVSRASGLWRSHGWRIAALWILSLVAYSNSFQTGLVLDNKPLILEDARVHAATAQNLNRILTGDYWPDRQAGLYRPVTTLSYLLNYAIFGNGPHPEGYHWFNFALHSVNVSLVYALGLMIFAAPIPAFALAAIWGLHPMLTECVTNVIGRADLLAGLSVLAGLFCYLKGQTSQGRRKLAWLAGLAAAQALGLFSKENAVILMALMLLSDVAWPGRTTAAKRLPFFAASALGCATFLLIRVQSHSQMQVLFTDNPLISAGFWTARLTAIKVLGKYIWLFFWPANLSPDYSFNAIPVFSWRLTEWEDVKTVVAAIVCAAGILLAIRWRRTQPRLFFFVICFFIAILPTSNLTIRIGSIMAERFAYLPFIGLAGCFVIAGQALAGQLSPKWSVAPKVMWVAAGLVCIGFAARTYARNFDWLDDASLWTQAVQTCPQSAKAHLNLGRVFLDVPGRVSDAIAEYETALRIDPDYGLAHYNLAVALSKIPGRLDDAIDHYRAALRSQPDYAQAHNNLGGALAQAPDRLPEAIAEFKAALRIDPNYVEAHNNLGDALSSIPGRMPEAIEEYRAAIRIQPYLATAHYNLGSALSAMPGRLEEAIAEYRLAIKAQPDFALAHNNLGTALAQVPGRLPEAIAEFKSAIDENPADANAHLNLGMALSKTPGRLPEAVVEFEAAVRLDPQLARAHYQLGIALSEIPGRYQDAIRELETASRLQPDLNLERDIERMRAHAK